MMSRATDPRVALVTGANRGLGFEVCRQLATKGWQVWLTARDFHQAKQAAAELGEGVTPLELDVTHDRSIAQAFAQVTHLNALINNAGIDDDTDQQAATADLGRVRAIFEVNVYGAWACAQTAVPLLRQQSHATIVNVSSGAGSITTMRSRPPGYSTSKAALNAFTRILAAELSGHGILVNAVCPGWVATDMGGGGRPVTEGASGIVWAAELPPGSKTGGFFRDRYPIAW